MTFINTNSFLRGLTQGGYEAFSPQQILDAFDSQLARRENYQLRKVFFLPPPSLEDAKLIVDQSKLAIARILEGHKLSPDAEVKKTAVREELVQLVREHLKKFAY